MNSSQVAKNVYLVAIYAAAILDDALLGFDDKRAKAALELLKELSKERQIILFTCQSREKMLINL